MGGYRPPCGFSLILEEEEPLLPGMVIAYACAPVPFGFLACDGAAVLRSSYPSLFAAIGTTYGPGDGSTTFNVPDLQGRTIIGSGSGAGLTTRARGNTGGAESVALQGTDIPTVSAVVNTSALAGSGGCAVAGDGGNVTDSFNANNAGASTLPAVMNPFGVATWIIKT